MSDVRELLERVGDRVSMRPDALEHVARRRARRQWSRKVATAVLAFAVAIAGGAMAFVAFGGPRLGPAVTPSGYFVQLPAELEPAPEDPNGGGRLVATTNLPEGTMVSITYGILDAGGESSGGGGGITGLAVEDGELSAMINNQSCYYLVGRQATSAGVDVTVTVSPVPVGPISVPAGYEVDSSQPPEVLEVLGEDFEHLTGPQVRTEDGVRELVATGSYAWPADSCAGTREQFVPAVCEPTQGQLQGDDLEQAVGEVMGAIGQGRLCEIWQLALPPEIEAEHPWDAFRREWSEWLSGSLGDVTQPDDPYSSALTWELVSQDDTGYTVEVSLRGTPVATLTFVPLPDWPGASDPGVVPFWGLIDYTLFDV